MRFRLIRHDLVTIVIKSKFEKVKSLLCSFCKSAEETIIYLFSECLCAQYIWNQTQIFFQDILIFTDKSVITNL